MKPSVGRIVHFHTTSPPKTDNGVGKGPYAALITQVFTDGDGNPTYCNLRVFTPTDGEKDCLSVPQRDSKFDVTGTYFWDWPPRVD